MDQDPTKPGETGPEHWERRFDELAALYHELVALVKSNATVARKAATDAATNAAIKVTAENARTQAEIRHELTQRQDMDRRGQENLHRKVDGLTDQMSDVLTTLNKLSTAKLTQLGITALI